MTADRVPMDRRELFKILGAGLAANRLAAQHHDPGSSQPVDIASYQPRFLSPIQYQTVDRLCDLLIPADEMGPGAHQAGVPFYIDSILHYGSSAEQQAWRRGLGEVEQEASARFGNIFLECTVVQQKQLFAAMAANEEKPETEREKFFSQLKKLAVEAYCMSEVAQREYFGYRGDTELAEFSGCTHPEHQR